MTDYCGPDKSPAWVKKVLSADLIPGGSLNEACRLHDEDYAAGKPKGKSDLKMLGRGLKRNWWNPYGWVKSLVYYIGVTVGGKDAYEEAQKNV